MNIFGMILDRLAKLVFPMVGMPTPGDAHRDDHPLSKVSPLDVGAALTVKAREMGGDLDPLHSIVDLMKVLDLAPDLEARAALADVFDPDRSYVGSAADNEWLQAQVKEALRTPYNWRMLTG